MSSHPLVWSVPVFAALVVACIRLVATDLRERRLPDAVMFPAAVTGAAGIVVASYATGDWADAGRALVGGGVATATYLALALIRPGGLGLGDVKFAGLLGGHLAWLGWPQLMLGLTLPFVLGGIYCVCLVIGGRARRGSAIAFGPFMALGAVGGVLVGG